MLGNVDQLQLAGVFHFCDIQPIELPTELCNVQLPHTARAHCEAVSRLEPQGRRNHTDAREDGPSILQYPAINRRVRCPIDSFTTAVTARLGVSLQQHPAH
jgi:hypothetical protein